MSTTRALTPRIPRGPNGPNSSLLSTPTSNGASDASPWNATSPNTRTLPARPLGRRRPTPREGQGPPRRSRSKPRRNSPWSCSTRSEPGAPAAGDFPLGRTGVACRRRRCIGRHDRARAAPGFIDKVGLGPGRSLETARSCRLLWLSHQDSEWSWRTRTVRFVPNGVSNTGGRPQSPLRLDGPSAGAGHATPSLSFVSTRVNPTWSSA